MVSAAGKRSPIEVIEADAARKSGGEIETQGCRVWATSVTTDRNNLSTSIAALIVRPGSTYADIVSTFFRAR